MPTTIISLSDYKIFIGNSFHALNIIMERNKYSKIFILVDENTKKYCLPILEKELVKIKNAKIIEIESGEKFKNIETTQIIWKKMMENNADRKSLLINLGGGVIGDLGGWAATTYKRGIDFIQIPTTLLSQVDASIGGKLGIDIWEFKNLIGVFKNPKAVIIFPQFLKTLPEREIKSGWAEIIKHSLIANGNYWLRIKEIKPDGNRNIKINWERFITNSLKIKKIIVENDPEEKNIRKVLNFGHTIGHAMESLSLKKDVSPLTHGEAVAIGMICAVFLSQQKLGLNKTKAKEIIEYIFPIYGKYKFSEKHLPELMNYILQDKKNINHVINFTLLQHIGKPVFNQHVSLKEIQESLRFYSHLQ